MITLEVDGEEFSEFEEVSVETSLESFCDQFTFLAFTNTDQTFPILNGQECRVLIDDIPVITGFIESTEISYDGESRSIRLQGRDRTGDILDSTIGEDISFTNISMKALIEKVIKSLGVTKVSVIDNSGGITPFTESDKIVSEIGMGAFEFLQKYGRKRQILLTTDGDSNIVISRGSGESLGFQLINDPATPDLGNIKSATLVKNDSERFFKYVVKSQEGSFNISAIGNGNPADLVNNGSIAFDDDVRKSRVLTMVQETSSTKDQTDTRVKWQANINRTRALRYTVTVAGHSDRQTGEIWRKNALVNVRDLMAGVDGEFLISGVTYTYNLTDGSLSTLEIVNKDAFSLQASEPVEQKKTSGFGLI